MHLTESKIIFIVSLPRSGSTFLQRMLSGHPEVYAQGELWLLLDLIYLRRLGAVKADYGPSQLADVANQFIAAHPNGESEYARIVSRFYLDFFNTYIDSPKTWLVDKTPRYHLMLPELKATFPTAKFIVLYRDPLAVFGSYVNAMRGNKLRRTDAFHLDLIDGPKHIADFYEAHSNDVVCVRYEDLVASPDETLKDLFSDLELDYDASLVAGFGQQDMKGKGDAMASRSFDGIVDRSKSWAGFIDSPMRKSVARKFLNATDDRYLRQGGYDAVQMLTELEAHQTGRLRPEECFYRFEELVAKVWRKLKG